MSAMAIDGWTYVAIAFFGAAAAAFGSDEAAKYIEPMYLFWLRTFCTIAGASFLALKMFRSTAYADSKTETETETKVKL